MVNINRDKAQALGVTADQMLGTHKGDGAITALMLFVDRRDLPVAHARSLADCLLLPPLQERRHPSGEESRSTAQGIAQVARGRTILPPACDILTRRWQTLTIRGRMAVTF